MQILIGFGIAFSGMIIGFILHGLLHQSQINELSRTMARQFIGEYMELLDKTQKGELTEEYLNEYLEERSLL